MRNDFLKDVENSFFQRLGCIDVFVTQQDEWNIITRCNINDDVGNINLSISSCEDMIFLMDLMRSFNELGLLLRT